MADTASQLGKITAGLEQCFTQLERASGALDAVKWAMELSDSMVQSQARLHVMVEDEGGVAALESQIFASAMRTRTPYLETANAVAALAATGGEVFTGGEEMIAFTQQVQKQSMLGGADGDGQAAVMETITGAMSAGTLDAGGLDILLTQAPGIAAALESCLVIPPGALAQAVESGLVTAQVFRQALFQVAAETDARFAQMPITWGQIWGGMGNVALLALQPLLTGLGWVADNLGILMPLVAGLGAAFLVFQAAAHWMQITTLWTQLAAAATGLYHGVLGFLSLGFGVLTGSTAASSAAVFAFNSALLSSPITWVVMLILVLVGVIYALVAAVNKFAGTSVSATGIILGAFTTLLAFLCNTFVIPLLNVFAAVGNFLGNVFTDPIAAVKVLFLDLCLVVLGYLQTLAVGIETLLNKIPGVQVEITAGLDGFYNQLEATRQQVKDQAQWVEHVTAAEFMEYEAAFNQGYGAGQGVDDQLKGMLGGGAGEDPGLYGAAAGGDSFTKLMGTKVDPTTRGMDATGDPNGFLGHEITGNLSQIADNTGTTADAVKPGKSDLTYLRELAERDAINRFTTAEIKVDMSGMTNRIDREMDIDGVINRFTQGVQEALMICAEGVHA